MTDSTALSGNIPSSSNSNPLSRYRLIVHNSPALCDVLNFRGTEALSQPFSWRIEFTSPQAHLRNRDLLMKFADFTLGDRKTVYGIVTGMAWLGTSADESRYSLTLESRLALLAHSRGCAVYQQLSVPEVVEQVLRKHGLEGPDFEFRLTRTYPEHEVITQWRET
ncbi:MAG: contractile injection system protein, VgrG/Pvc8 family, partial [Yersiniaceae bacterium]|nr:contractile injection system protein, VgrG/Pvc8 family [Yersiniaceae bacterium]